MSSNHRIRSSSSSSSLRQIAVQPTLAQQQQQQLQDIKPALLSQSFTFRPKYTYKDKFQALRERYDQVLATNEALHKELALAQAKTQKLEAENNLLIDGIGIIAPYETSIEHYLSVQDAIDQQQRQQQQQQQQQQQHTHGPPPTTSTTQNQNPSPNNQIPNGSSESTQQFTNGAGRITIIDGKL